MIIMLEDKKKAHKKEILSHLKYIVYSLILKDLYLHYDASTNELYSSQIRYKS